MHEQEAGNYNTGFVTKMYGKGTIGNRREGFLPAMI
jgi:hypothetical protein